MATNSFVKNSATTLIRQVIGIIVGLFTQIIIARYLGVDGQGKYALITLLSTLLFTFFNFGIGISSVYYIGQGKIKLNTIYKTNVISAILLSILSFLVGLVIIFFFSDLFFHGIPKSTLLITLIILPFLFLYNFNQTIFQGKQDFISHNAILLANQLAILIVSILLIVVFDFGLNGAVFAFLFGQFFTYLVSNYLLHKRIGVRLTDGDFSLPYYKDSLIYGIKAHLYNIMTFLNYRADVLFVSYFINPSAVGIYNVSVNIAERIWIFSTSISMVLFPKISSYKTDKEKNVLTSVVSRNVLFVSLIGAFLLYFLSDFFITLLFGKQYIQASDVLKWLLPGIVVGSSARILSNDLAGRGKPEINMYISFLTVILNMVLNAILIPYVGIYGAAIATTITYGIDFLIKVLIFKKYTGLSFSSFLLVGPEDFRLYKAFLRKFQFKLKLKRKVNS